MTAQRLISAVLVVVSVVACAVTGGVFLGLAFGSSRRYVPVLTAVMVCVLACALAAVILTIVLAVRAMSSSRNARMVPRLISAMSTILGLLSVVSVVSAVFILFFLGGDHSAAGALPAVAFAAMALVSAAMMMIAANFRALLDKYRRADSELSRVI